MCDESTMIPSGIIFVISFEIMAGAIVLVACSARFIFVPESTIVSVF